MTQQNGLRILVSAVCFADALAALRLVTQLPISDGTRIGGLLIEDVTALSACYIPNQRIVLIDGTTALAPSNAQVNALMKADAKAFRQLLAQVAEPRGTDWNFSHGKGELITTALHIATDWDMLIIGHRSLNKILGKTVVLQNTGQASTEIHRVAKHLSDDYLVFSIAANTQENNTPPEANEYIFDSLEQAMDTLKKLNLQSVLLDLTEGPVQNQRQLERVLENSRCPLMLFGTSDTQSMLEFSTIIPPLFD